jgi:hypothetical protein
MPQTHPLYQLVVAFDGYAPLVSSLAARGTLDEVLEQASTTNHQCKRAGWDNQRYYVEPVPGTEPRYTLHLHWYNKDAPCAEPTNWHMMGSVGTPLPLPYLAARTLFEEWSACSGLRDQARLVMVAA